MAYKCPGQVHLEKVDQHAQMHKAMPTAAQLLYLSLCVTVQLLTFVEDRQAGANNC